MGLCESGICGEQDSEARFKHGRDDNGNVLPAANYLAVFQANSVDQFTNYTGFGADLAGDISIATTRQLAIDPLQITDIRVQPLTGGSTSLAVMSYLLTEAATVYIDIYPPGTQFCPSGANATINDVANPLGDPTGAQPDGCSPPESAEGPSHALSSFSRH